MIKSCNHSAHELLCGTCREKNYRESYIEEKDRMISELGKKLAASEQRVKALEEALFFIGVRAWKASSSGLTRLKALEVFNGTNK